MALSVTWPESNLACISLAERKMPPKQVGSEDSCSKGLAEHYQGRHPPSGDVCVLQTFNFDQV